MRKTLLNLGCLALVVFTGCTGESNRPVATGTANFRAINAIPTSPTFTLLIEERAMSTAGFKANSSANSFDDLDYIFNFEVDLAGDILRTRVASVLVETVRDMEYSFLITGDIAAPTITVWEQVRREWEGTEAVSQAAFAHAAASVGPVDFYMAAPGILPAAGQEVGTVSFQEILPYIDFPDGEYVVHMTTAGQPGDILFTSDTFTPLVQNGFTITLYDTDPNDLGLYSVRVISDGGLSSRFPDVNVLPTTRFFHASTFLETSDVYIDEMLTDQVLADHAFRDVSAEVQMPPGLVPITYTMIDNTGSIYLEDTSFLNAGARHDFYVVGDMDSLVGNMAVLDRRPIETRVRFNFMHTALNHPVVDLYIVDVGADISESFPRFSNVPVFPSPSGISLPEGDYEMYLTPALDTTVLAGPIAISPMLGDILDYVTYDNVDPAIADLVSIPLP